MYSKLSFHGIHSFPFLFLSIFIKTSGGISIVWNTFEGHAAGSDVSLQDVSPSGKEGNSIEGSSAL